MNPNRGSLFVPGTGRMPNLAGWLRSGVPTRRLWRGFAARSTGVDARREWPPGGLRGDLRASRR